MDHPEPVTVSVRQAADITSLSECAIYTAVYSGELPAKRRGRRILIPVDELKRWIESLPDA